MAALRFIDIGANLTDPMFRGIYHGKSVHVPDLDKVLSRARNVGLERQIITSGSLSDVREAKAVAEVADDLYYTVGVHPTRCNEFEEESVGAEMYLNSLKSEIEIGGKKVVAIGECGLDYDRLHFCERETQLKYFELQLSTFASGKLPFFLHSRNAGSDFFDLMKKYPLTAGGAVHSFTGAASELDQLLELGLYIGVNGCSLKTSDNLAVVAKIPLERIMLETDCPWCMIKKSSAANEFVQTRSWTSLKKEKYSGELETMVKDRCEPAQIIQVAEAVAGVHQVTVAEVAEQAWKNSMQLFFPNA